jgi:hypothetical protein
VVLLQLNFVSCTFSELGALGILGSSVKTVLSVTVSDMPRLAEATLTLLRQESCCQQVESDGEDDGDIDHDEVLMDAVSDLLPAFVKVMRAYFDPVFAKLFDPLMKFAVSNLPTLSLGHAQLMPAVLNV